MSAEIEQSDALDSDGIREELGQVMAFAERKRDLGELKRAFGGTSEDA